MDRVPSASRQKRGDSVAPHREEPRLSGQTFYRPKLVLQHRWVKMRGTLAHLVVLRSALGRADVSATRRYP
eukprot:scaffold20110_cov140-Isochrysis_galbana.AAC.1